VFSLSEKTSVLFQGQVYPYDTLRAQIHAVKSMFSGRMPAKNEPVALCLKRTPYMITAVIAMLEMEVTFMPVDLSQPKARTRDMLSRAGVRYILTDAEEPEEGYTVLRLEESPAEPAANTQKAGSDLAYIMFTSGTVGKPKGVAVRRSGLENFLAAIPEVIPFETGSSMTCFTNNVFDIFYLETLVAANVGMQIILSDAEEAKNPAALIRLLEQADYTQMTPSRMLMLQTLDAGLSFLRNVKAVLLGGEALPQSLLTALQQHTAAEIYNMYGPVETTVWSSAARLTDSAKVHIGTPIRNTEFCILSENGELLPDGKIGEIVITGDGLAAGYIGDEALTAEKFMTLKDGRRCYRTGDLGRRNEEGNYECGGRIDTLVKINGFRVELEEIDSVIASAFSGVTAAAVYRKEQGLTAFYTGPAEISAEEFDAALTAYLPHYMIPGRYIRTEALIYTPSGKIDRRALAARIPDPETAAGEPEAAEPDTKIYAVIARVLNVPSEQVGYDVRLKDIGMDSLSIIKMIVELEACFDIEFEDEMLTREAFYYCGELCDYVKKRISAAE